MVSCFSRIQLFATPWTVAYQAPLSMWFSRQEYLSGLPCSSPGDHPNQELELMSLTSPALASRHFITRATSDIRPRWGYKTLEGRDDLFLYSLYCPLQCLAHHAAAAAKLLQSCPTLCNSIEGSPPGSPIPGILQARTLEWVAISFSSAWNWKVKVKLLSHVWLLATPWTAAHQAPLSMGFSRQEYWSGVLH